MPFLATLVPWWLLKFFRPTSLLVWWSQMDSQILIYANRFIQEILKPIKLFFFCR